MPMQRILRRDFLKTSLLPTAALPLFPSQAVAVQAADNEPPAAAAEPPRIIDTNVHLFDWPFRSLKYRQTADFVAKLRKHRVTEAWAGSFEALLHKNLDAANARLANECKVNGGGMLLPFGSVNPVWPDWEEDLRRCHEAYRMPGIRLYPNYHNYALDRPEVLQLLGRATERGLLIQIAIEMEDQRVHHPVINVPPVDATPLLEAWKQVPGARIQLLNSFAALNRRNASRLVEETKIVFDIANLEGTGAVGRLIEGKHWSIRSQVPHERLLFGSHAPFFPCEAAVLRLFESPLEREQLLAIMQENARRLLART
jgi:predicted TIM-barrel fold metal-dependent hydrolase